MFVKLTLYFSILVSQNFKGNSLIKKALLFKIMIVFSGLWIKFMEENKQKITGYGYYLLLEIT